MLEIVLILLGVVSGLTALLFWAVNRPVVCPREPASPARSAYEKPSVRTPSMLDAQFAPNAPSIVYASMTAA
jgi:hypothetical protein